MTFATGGKNCCHESPPSWCMAWHAQKTRSGTCHRCARHQRRIGVRCSCGNPSRSNHFPKSLASSELCSPAWAMANIPRPPFPRLRRSSLFDNMVNVPCCFLKQRSTYATALSIGSWGTSKPAFLADRKNMTCHPVTDKSESGLSSRRVTYRQPPLSALSGFGQACIFNVASMALSIAFLCFSVLPPPIE